MKYMEVGVSRVVEGFLWSGCTQCCVTFKEG